MLATAGEELMTPQAKSAVREARGQELKYLPATSGVYEKVDERDAIARYQVTPVDTMWIDTPSIRGAHQVTSRGTRIQKWRPTRLVCGSLPWEVLKATNIIAANPQAHDRNLARERVRCYFHLKVQDLCLYVCQWRTEGASTRETFG